MIFYWLRGHSGVPCNMYADAVATADEVRAAHREQMEAYRSAVAALFGLPSSDVSCALVWLKDPSVAGVGAEVLEV